MRQLEVLRDWRYRDRARGSRMLSKGLYKIPDEISEKVATLAVEQGVVVIVPQYTDPVVEEKAIRRAPVNKAHRRAPKNK